MDQQQGSIIEESVMQYKGLWPTLAELYHEAFEGDHEFPEVFNERQFNEMDSTEKSTWKKSKEYTDKLFTTRGRKGRR